MLDDLARLTLLFDLYGALLTDKQRQVWALFYEEDLSLSEIGSELGISRQAVHDLLHRTEQTLCHYEEKLRLAARLKEERQKNEKIAALCREILAGKTQAAEEILALIAEED